MFRKFNKISTKREKRHKKSRPRASTRNSFQDSGNYFAEKNLETPPPNYSAVASISHSVVSSDIKSGRSSQSTSSSDSLKTFKNYSSSSIKDEKNKKR